MLTNSLQVGVVYCCRLGITLFHQGATESFTKATEGKDSSWPPLSKASTKHRRTGAMAAADADENYLIIFLLYLIISAWVAYQHMDW